MFTNLLQQSNKSNSKAYKKVNIEIKNSRNHKTFYNFIETNNIRSPPWLKFKVLNRNSQLNNNSRLLYDILFNKKKQSHSVFKKRPYKSKDDYLLITNKKGEQIRPSTGTYQQFQKRSNINLSAPYQKQLIQQRKKIWEKYTPLQPSNSRNFVYFLGNGNNSELVRRVMKKRTNWLQYQPGTSCSVNFKWQQTKQNFQFSQIQKRNLPQILNHFEHHEEISTKSGLIKNLQIYCETNKIEIFTITPMTFIINLESQYAEYQIKKFLKYFVRKNQPKNDKQRLIINEYLKKLKSMLKIPNCEIKKKINNLSKPILFDTYYDHQNLWLLKPTSLNRGRGIQLFNSFDQFQKLLKDLALRQKIKKIYDIKISLQRHQPTLKYESIRNSKTEKMQKKKKEGFKIKRVSKTQLNFGQYQKPITPTQSRTRKNLNQLSTENLQFILQKYIQKPLLIDGRKFDIRIWVLLDLDFEVHIFKEGYIRTSSQYFNLQNIDNYYIHLTNNAVQKNSQNYQQFEKGNQISFKDFQQYIKKTDINFKMSDIFQKIKEISFITMSSVKRKLDPRQREVSFQLFGFDFILDANFKVWLIEVNTNPCIQQSSPLLQMLIPRLIDDTMKLTIDIYFKTDLIDSQKSKDLKLQTNDSSIKQVFHVDGYKDNEIMFQNLGKLSPNSIYKKDAIIKYEQV